MANSRLCSIPHCGKPHYGNGYCKVHCYRLRTHGDPLGGGPDRAARGEPMRFIREVALNHIGAECLAWPFAKDSDGYGRIWIEGKMVRAHRYICELVHGVSPTPEHESAHSCGKGHEACIAPGHLEWKTHIDNMADTILHGTHGRGERNYGAKLTEADVREIISLKGVESQTNMAKRLGVSQPTIADIHTGRTWAWLTGATK